MNCYLMVDFGSTFTKLTLVDIDKERLVCTAKAPTTVETNVKFGFEAAFQKIRQLCGCEDLNIVDTLACSSAAGGLKIVAIGSTPRFTAEAAKHAAMGAGGRVLQSFGYNLSEENLAQIETELNPDIILLSGGTDGGDEDFIVHNAKMLSRLKSKVPIVVSGNKCAVPKICQIFDAVGADYVITENIMPEIERTNYPVVREEIRKVFMSHIVDAKGMKEIEQTIGKVMMPTPTAVLKAAELLADGCAEQAGLGEVMIVDIGGATTDVHSVSTPQKSISHLYVGLEESYVKRTVEGDLGMRYSALSLFEAVGRDNFLKYDDSLKHIEQRCMERHYNPAFLNNSEDNRRFDEVMAKNCVAFSTRRHAGVLRKIYTDRMLVVTQTGKDLREIDYVIGTGGVLVNSHDVKPILSCCLQDDKHVLLPQQPNFALDKSYVLSAMGLLSLSEPTLAFKILKDNLEIL